MAYKDLDKKRATKRAWYRKNKEKHAAWSKRYRLNNPEKIKKLHRRHYLKNKEKYLLSSKMQKLKDPIKYKEYMREYEKTNKERINTRKRNLYKRNKPRYLNTRYKRKLGVRGFDIESLYNENNGLCYACGRKMGALRGTRLNGNKPVLDHCHKTGLFRGILHSTCNIAIGFAKDDPNILRQLADYLDKFNNNVKQPT